MACIARALKPAASFGAPTRSRRALRGLPVRSPSSSRDAADVRDAVSPRAFNPFAPPPDLSGDLLSAVAKFALETNLASHASVDAAVDAQVLGLLGGKVDGVVTRAATGDPAATSPAGPFASPSARSPSTRAPSSPTGS